MSKGYARTMFVISSAIVPKYGEDRAILWGEDEFRETEEEAREYVLAEISKSIVGHFGSKDVKVSYYPKGSKEFTQAAITGENETFSWTIDSKENNATVEDSSVLSREDLLYLVTAANIAGYCEVKKDFVIPDDNRLLVACQSIVEKYKGLIQQGKTVDFFAFAETEIGKTFGPDELTESAFSDED